MQLIFLHNGVEIRSATLAGWKNLLSYCLNVGKIYFQCAKEGDSMPKALFKSDDELFEAIQRCRTSGMTDKDWCAANGISQTAFYRYIRKLKKKSYEIPNHTRFRKQEVVPVQIVPDGQESLPSTIPEHDVTARRGLSTRESGIHISCGSFRVDIDNNADPNTLQDTLMILRSLC
jgi:hypothetical protein